MKEYDGDEGSLMTIALAEYQTAGKGQGQNSWESERGMNLTFSVKIYPTNVPIIRQYVLLEAKSLAIAETLRIYTDGITIKWPNDVYWKDRKISGTLSECVIAGNRIRSCILGTGINVNQETFTSNAPNPISLKQITGKDIDKDILLNAFIKNFQIYLDIINQGKLDDIHSLYLKNLYRRGGVFKYSDCNGEFMASIYRVEPEGNLVLQRVDGSLSKYAFKEVEVVL